MLFRRRKLYLRFVLLAIVLLLVVTSPRVLSQQQTSSSVAPTTRLFFTVLDKNKRAVMTLRREDISVSEDGKPQEILSFERQTDPPLSLAILIDTSVSQERVLPNTKLAAQAFVEYMMRSGADKVSVITFTGTTKVLTPLTDDVERVQQAIEQVRFIPPGGYVSGGQAAAPSGKTSNDKMLAGSTALWDAIWTTSEEVLEPSAGTTRRVMVLITDGSDTSSRKKMSEAIDRAIKAETLIFAIVIGDEYFEDTEQQPLSKASERSGGRSFAPKKFSDLPKIFREIEQELRSQYSVTYSPANTKAKNSLRKIKIELVNPELRKEKLRLSHPQGYFAKG